MIIEAIYKAIQCEAANISYICMIMSMMVTAGFITIIYPFAVFGYALMEENRPGKLFWSIIMKYTLIILILKFITQLDIWDI